VKIKTLQSRAGHANPDYRLADFSFPPGVVIDIDSRLAEAWIASKTAIAAPDEKLTMPIEVYTLPERPAGSAVAQPKAPKQPKALKQPKAVDSAESGS
jgi:hypothetical protein